MVTLSNEILLLILSTHENFIVMFAFFYFSKADFTFQILLLLAAGIKMSSTYLMKLYGLLFFAGE